MKNMNKKIYSGFKAKQLISTYTYNIATMLSHMHAIFHTANMKYQMHLKVLKLLSKSYQDLTKPVSSPDKDKGDMIYEDLESSVQESKDITATDVKMEDNPAYDTSVL